MNRKLNGIVGFLDLLSKTTYSQQQDDYIKEIKNASEVLL